MRACCTRLAAAVLGLAGAALSSWAAPDPVEVAELRETIAQWAETERLASEEGAAWAARKASMEELLQLYRDELALLDEELAEAGQAAVTLDERQQQMQGEVAALRNARAHIEAAFAEARTLLLPLVERFPAPLQDQLAGPIGELEEWGAGDELRPGLQALLAILDQANGFARTVTRAREVREGREVEVIYAGLSHAYYLSRDGGAGLGQLTPSGWRWEERKELHGKVAQVMAQLDESSPPALVRLPVPAAERKGGE